MNNLNVNKSGYMPKFTGIKYNNSLKMAKEYAINTGQKDEFKNIKRLVNKYSGENLSITVRKNKFPYDCLHVSILNKGRLNKFIGGLDYLHSANEPIGKVVFDILKNLADKTSKIHKTIFRK